VTFTGGSDVTGFDAVRVGRGMPRAPVPFCGCGGTPHGRGSFCGAYGVRGSAVRARKRGSKTNRCRNKGAFIHTMYRKRGCRYLVAPEPFGDGVRDLEECSGRVSEESAARTYCLFRLDLDSAGSFCLSRRTWDAERKRDGRGLPAPRRKEKEGERRKRDGRGSLAMGGNGPGKRKKREGRGSLAMGGNGPGITGESGKAGVPSQWEGTGQEESRRERESRAFPRNGRERARKRGESGKAGVPSQWEGTGQEERRKRVVALRNATMAIGRSRRPRGPTYARGANRSQFEDPELAVNARHLATRRAHPAFKFFYVAHSGSGKFQFRVICASHHGGAGRTHVTPANVRLRWPHASRLASCNLSFRTPLSLSLSLHFLFFSSQR
jgi:hypothetical protein